MIFAMNVLLSASVKAVYDSTGQSHALYRNSEWKLDDILS